MKQLFHILITDPTTDPPGKKRWDICYAASRPDARLAAQAMYPDCQIGVLTKSEFEGTAQHGA